MAKCVCCSFPSSEGVVTFQTVIRTQQKCFVCVSCFMNPNLFFNSKRVLPHWTLAVQLQEKRNPYGRSQEAVGYFALTKKAKMETAMSESLYTGQKQL